MVTAALAAAWKMLAKNERTADDYLLAFELLIAALSVQLTFLGTGLVEVTGSDGPDNDQLWQQIAARCGLLVIVGVIVLPLFAIFVRSRTCHEPLTPGLAIVVSVLAGSVLFAIVLLNHFLPAVS